MLLHISGPDPNPTPPHQAQNRSLARRTAASTSTGLLVPANFCSAGWSLRRKGLYVLSPCAARAESMSLVAGNNASLLCVTLWWLFVTAGVLTQYLSVTLWHGCNPKQSPSVQGASCVNSTPPNLATELPHGSSAHGLSSGPTRAGKNSNTLAPPYGRACAHAL